MITIDSIIINPDRHFNNLALIYDDIKEEYRFAPIFDNGMGLLMGEHIYKDKPLEYQSERTFSKPFYHNFETQYKFLKCPGMTFDKAKVIELIEEYNDDRITHVMELAFRRFPGAFTETIKENKIKSF